MRLLLPLLAAILLVVAPARAATSYQVNSSASVTIDEFGTCRLVTNSHASGLAIFVPTATNAEWTSFYSNLPAGVTATACDTTPNAFSFADQTGVALNTLTTSNTVTITGISVPVSASVSGAGSPQIRINGGSWVSSGTISNGQTLEVRLTSANANSTMRSATVTVSTVSDQWDVTTLAAGSCALPWGGSIANGASVTAYYMDSTCNCAGMAEQRTCTNGTLSGVSTYQSCGPPPLCWQLTDVNPGLPGSGCPEGVFSGAACAPQGDSCSENPSGFQLVFTCLPPP